MFGSDGEGASKCLGSEIIDQSQNITVTAMEMANINVLAHRS